MVNNVQIDSPEERDDQDTYLLSISAAEIEAVEVLYIWPRQEDSPATAEHGHRDYYTGSHKK